MDLDTLIGRLDLARAEGRRATISPADLDVVVDSLKVHQQAHRIFASIDELEDQLVHITVDADAGFEILDAVETRTASIDHSFPEGYGQRAAAHRVLADVLDAMEARANRLDQAATHG